MATPWSEEVALTVITMHKEGRSNYLIGKAIGKDPHSVAEWLYRHGYSQTAEKCHPHSDTLCWHCGKATGGGDCEWANSKCKKTVPGWKAIPTFKGSRDMWSYIVEECPKFVKG